MFHGENFHLILRRDHQKNSYERRDYVSVDDNRLSWAMSQKKKKTNPGHARYISVQLETW